MGIHVRKSTYNMMIYKTMSSPASKAVPNALKSALSVDRCTLEETRIAI